MFRTKTASAAGKSSMFRPNYKFAAQEGDNSDARF